VQVVSVVVRPLFAPSATPPPLATDHLLELAASVVASHCLSQTVGLGPCLSKPFSENKLTPRTSEMPPEQDVEELKN